MSGIYTRRELVGQIGVDSGQMMLIDPCYLDKWDCDEYDAENDNPLSYSRACRGTFEEGKGFKASILGRGLAAVTSSGFGDGLYDVYVTWGEYGSWGTRAIKMEIIFLDEEE